MTNTAARRAAHWGRRVRWYVREFTGEGTYDRYVAHTRRQHPDTEPASRAEFERRRMDEREADPRNGFRCC
ncbi:YbdD/YjiX family protein [Streptomyces buecherae]|uniref:YbdD/YjiX family protein n=1 Tax=Streptomyces buecherae TaxID=2763006 RepID=A0A7H8NCZ7_9ACTN|nr:YbdD/YjiX family protein [Streptomyces buecherae]QKW52292.1 YbdD/YjiX family protein [Streptomyces buecherae]